MTNEQIIASWKNPSLRAQFNNLPEHPAGQPEFSNSLNAADVQAETTPALAMSSWVCGDVAASIIITIAYC